MDTLKTSLAPSLAHGVWLWHVTAGRLITWWQRLHRSDEDCFLDEATDLADLERRLDQLERSGLQSR